jgi:iron(III) transport system permease protein
MLDKRVMKTRARSVWIYQLLMGLGILVIAAAVLVPIAILVILSFQTVTKLGQGPATLGNYRALLGSHQAWTALENTLIFTVGAALLALVLGGVMAWAVTSVNVPFRQVLRILPVCVLILPPLVKDPAWIILFGKDTGLVNIFASHVLGIHHSIVNVFSMPGMISVAGVFSAPMAYSILLTPFQGIDRSQIEASRMSGARLPRTLFKIVLPTVTPALLSAGTLLVILIASGFETPVLIGLPAGVPTYMSQIYESVNSPVHGLNFAATQGSLYLVLTTVMVVLYLFATRNERRFVSVGGRGHLHTLIEAPVLRWVLAGFVALYALFGFIGPLVITILTSIVPFYSAVNGNPFHNFTLDNFRAVYTTPEVLKGIETSGLLALGVAVGVVFVAGLLAVVALKTRSRFRRVCEFVAMAPIAMPALVYSVGLLLTVLSVPGLARIAYGSKGLMYVAEIVVFIPVTMRLISSALIQVGDELIEASRLSGASMARSVRLILAPIIRPALLYAGAVIFVLAYRELGAVVFLVANNTSIVPYVSFTFWVSGGYPMLAALNVVTLIVPLVIICVAFFFARVKVRPSVTNITPAMIPAPAAPAAAVTLSEVPENVG